MRFGSKIACAFGAVAICAVVLSLVSGDSASAAEIGENPADYANITWVAICTILVFIMTPGVALFYGGMLRKQSMTSIIAQTLLSMAVMGISWVVVGYSLAFSDGNAFIGGLDNYLLSGVSATEIAEGSTIPDMEFMLFQMVFAMITAGIVLGACAERIKYTAHGSVS